MASQGTPPKNRLSNIFLIGFGFFGISVMWKLYNHYVPIFLQAGNPAFQTSTKAPGFGSAPHSPAF